MVAEQALARQWKKDIQADSSFVCAEVDQRPLRGRKRPGGKVRAFHLGVALRKSPLPTRVRPKQTAVLFLIQERETVGKLFIPQSLLEKLCCI